MFLETIKFHGLPPRGSLQDRVACEMLRRQRNRKIMENVYLGRLLAATINLDENVFRLWTELYSQEVFHNTYTPATVSGKNVALKVLRKKLVGDVEDRQHMFRKLRKLTVKEADMRPLTAREREVARRRLRAARLKKANQDK